jgi:uncharacterized membrane protein YbjE (DUF340 family)
VRRSWHWQTVEPAAGAAALRATRSTRIPHRGILVRVPADPHTHHPSGAPLNRLAFSATVHCLTGCAIGEILGMILSTWWAWGNAASIALSIVLAFLFGYTLTSLPLLRSGLSLRQVAPLAFASDTASITTMEIVDNLFILIVPGAIAAGLGDALFWWSLAVGLLIAGALAFPVNRWLLARGRGHAAVHQYHHAQ